MGIEVTQADRDAAALLSEEYGEQHEADRIRAHQEQCDHWPDIQAFARHRQAAFADGVKAALQGAEAIIWRIEDDSFLYKNVSEALQEVISELQAMEQNWTGRATIEHRQAAIKERDAQIERLREALTTIFHEGGQAEARFALAALGDWKSEAGDLGGKQ